MKKITNILIGIGIGLGIIIISYTGWQLLNNWISFNERLLINEQQIKDNRQMWDDIKRELMKAEGFYKCGNLIKNWATIEEFESGQCKYVLYKEIE